MKSISLFPEDNTVLAQSELKSLAETIIAEHQTIGRLLGKSLDHARRAGEALLQVKQTLPHGQFTAWVLENCGFTDRTARSYMKVATGWGKIAEERKRASGLDSVREAVKFLSEPDEVPAAPSLVPRYPKDIRRADISPEALEDWEPQVGEAVIGMLPDGRTLMIESDGDSTEYVRKALFDDAGVTFTRRAMNRRYLFFSLWNDGIEDIGVVEWLVRCPATLEGNPLAKFMVEDWRYPAPADGCAQ